MAVEFKHGDYIKGGWELVKANLVPCVVAMVVQFILSCTFIGMIVMPQIAVNLYKGLKEAKASGKPIEIGSLFAFDNFVNNFVAFLIMFALVAIIGWIPLVVFVIQALFLFLGPILADKPGIAFMDAVKAAFAFAKGNFVPSIIFVLVCTVVSFIGMLLCGVGSLVAFPITMAATWLAYDEHRAAVAASAAEMGVTLA